MKNVFDDEKNKKPETRGETKGETKQDIEARVRAELKAEGVSATKKSIAERTRLIKEIQKKKNKSEDDKILLNREMKERAKDNALLPRDLGRLQPSQMTLEEMVSYCNEKNISFDKGDNTILLRARIKAFRNPGQAERLRMLEDKALAGKIIR